VQLAYRDFGEGPALLLLGERSTTMNWWPAEMLRDLSQTYRVITMDARGVGYSTDNPAVGLSFSRMAEDASGLLFGLGISSASVLGWGMGADVGLLMALADSRRIKRLVMSGGDPGGSLSTPGIPEVEAILTDPRAEPEQLLAVMFNPSAREAKQAFLQALSAMPSEQVGEKALRSQAQAVAAWRKDDGPGNKLGAVSIPVMVHYGTRDVIAPPANGEILSERIPGARREPVEGGGHACLFEQMESFLALTLDFLK
jgi:pimeloyl-ACP methyl ester carboxylesterase